MAEETMENGSLDDSLTSIQWLCQLESNKLLETKSEKQKPVTSTPVDCSTDNYNPYRKPQYSYASLIVLAIYSSRDKRMTLQDIYAWIEDNFPYYQYAKKGWRNSIRHNLSLHKFFVKEQRADVLRGKGSYWRISPEGKENLMRDLLKPPVNNLQPPIALLPHDPNRKLRQILPKPTFDPTGLQYVPFMNYNLPIVFVNESGAPIAQDPIHTTPNQEQRNCKETVAVGSCVVKSNSESVAVESASCHQSQSVVSGNTLQVSKSDFEGRFSVGTSTKDLLCTPIQDQRNHSKRKTADCAPKDSARKRQCSSKVSQNSKRLPNILRRNKSRAVKSPDVRDARMQTPLKNSVQSTLAAINSGNRTPYSPNRKSITNTLNASESSPTEYNRSFDFLQHYFGSPGFSPLRSPVCFSSGLTPISQSECDSGIVITPLKSSLGDLSFNWTPFNSGLTTISSLSTRTSNSSSSTTQRCRKSLGLEQINEITEYTQ